MTVDDLIAELQSRSKPSRALDRDIALLVHPEWRVSRDKYWSEGNHDEWCIRRDGRLDVPCDEALPFYTGSIDAALTLLPEMWWLQHLGQITKGWRVRVETDGISVPKETHPLRAATPSLAICIASLLDRQATT